MSWVAIAEASALPEGRATVVETAGRRLALCRVGGSFYAIDDLCTHDGGPLGEGVLDGLAIECPRHGARFDLVSGRALCLPAITGVRSYPTRLAGGTVEADLP